MNKTLLNSLFVFIAGSSYGFIVPVIKAAAVAGIQPTAFLPLQYLIALGLCLGTSLITRAPWGRPRQVLPCMVLGFLTGGCSICYYTSVSLLPSAAALTLLFQYVWISVVIECVHKRHLPSVSDVVAVLVVLGGTICATGLLDGSLGDLDPRGVAFGMGSALCYASFLYLSGTLGTDQPTVVRTTMLSLGGLVVTGAICPLAFGMAPPDGAIGLFALAGAFLGILIPTTIINFAAPKLSPSMVSIMASSELPVGVLAAWLFVADIPTPTVCFGAVLVLVGIVIEQLPGLLRSRPKA